MSTEKTKRQQEWETLISETIKKRDLYGRSFTAGVALFILATEGWLEEDMADELDDMIHMYIGDDLIMDMEKRGLSTWYKDLINVLDLAVIDEIAKELEGDNEEDY